MSKITNISCYKFARLGGLQSLKEELLENCRDWNLKGTILLSEEGINFFIAGIRANVDRLVSRLRKEPGLEDLTPKYSESDDQPFTRMLVRIKREIIAFGVKGIDPANKPSPKLPPQTLKQWLDEGRPLTLLDTRNTYEVKLGTFKGATDLGIDRFRQFPNAVAQLPPETKKAPIVMFCTGGIRCEKAGPFLENQGFENVFQLDGGILKYFEECGGAHYEGECFVFDQRVGLDPALHETPSSQCFACQAPLTKGEQDDPRFVVGVSCPHCFQTVQDRQRLQLENRQEAIREAVNPLPGSKTSFQRLPFHVPPSLGGLTLEALSAHLPDPDAWRVASFEGRVINEAGVSLTLQSLVEGDRRIYRQIPEAAEPPVPVNITLVYEDEGFIVVNKPENLPSVPYGPFKRNTLHHILSTVYEHSCLRPIAPLEVTSSGIMIFARTKRFADTLKAAFCRQPPTWTWMVETSGVADADAFLKIPNSTVIRIQDHELQLVTSDPGLDAQLKVTVPRLRRVRLSAMEFTHPLTGKPCSFTV